MSWWCCWWCLGEQVLVENRFLSPYMQPELSKQKPNASQMKYTHESWEFSLEQFGILIFVKKSQYVHDGPHLLLFSQTFLQSDIKTCFFIHIYKYIHLGCSGKPALLTHNSNFTHPVLLSACFLDIIYKNFSRYLSVNETIEFTMLKWYK